MFFNIIIKYSEFLFFFKTIYLNYTKMNEITYSV